MLFSAEQNRTHSKLPVVNDKLLEKRKNIDFLYDSPKGITQQYILEQYFSTAGPRPGTGPCHQFYRAARGSPGILHFSFLSRFHEQMFYSGNILRRKIFVNVSKSLDPDAGLRKLQYTTRFH